MISPEEEKRILEIAADLPKHPKLYPESAFELFDRLLVLRYNEGASDGTMRWSVQTELADGTKAIIRVINIQDGELARVQIRGMALQLLAHYLKSVAEAHPPATQPQEFCTFAFPLESVSATGFERCGLPYGHTGDHVRFRAVVGGGATQPTEADVVQMVSTPDLYSGDTGSNPVVGSNISKEVMPSGAFQKATKRISEIAGVASAQTRTEVGGATESAGTQSGASATQGAPCSNCEKAYSAMRSCLLLSESVRDQAVKEAVESLEAEVETLKAERDSWREVCNQILTLRGKNKELERTVTELRAREGE